MFLRKILLAVISSVLSLHIAFYTAETYFFDTFFYQKSIAHGYWPSAKNDISLRDFLPRSKDIIDLLEADTRNNATNSAKDDSGTYTIALIGDSFVWGQGVRYKNTLQYILEKKLNAFRNTTVLAFAQPGDSMLDNFLKYSRIQHMYPVDLYIFEITDNDFIINSLARYSREENDKLISLCTKMSGKSPTLFTNSVVSHEEYAVRLYESVTNPANLCILDYIAAHTANHNTIFFIPDNYNDDNGQYATYASGLKKHGLHVISSTVARSNPTYKTYWSDPYLYFEVSPTDGHASKIANRMYADSIVAELISNPKWKFDHK